MPYKSEKIKIEHTNLDRRIKLTDIEKLAIKSIRDKDGLSYQKIADIFKVSKRTIIFICKPETLEACKKSRAERGGSKIYYDKDKQTISTREHRKYKQDLFIKGKINIPA